ncbi:MAG: S-layer homology domain-containing protein, partial [Thermoanaerobaculia bacterium]
GYSAGCTNPTLTGNYFVSDTALKLVSCTGVTMTGNTFYDSVSGFTQSQYPSNTYLTSRPSGVKIFLRPNAYEAGRANITIYNWDLTPTVLVDLSGFLSPGAQYVVRNAQNPFAVPVLTGTYDGNLVPFPMTGLAPATPVGVPTPPPTGPEFNVFILTSTAGPYEFFDVPLSDPFHDAIHTVASNGITAGCGNGNFCPDDSTTRAQMAVFLLKSKYGSAYVPAPATGAMFDDVPANAFAAAWIEQLAAEGISTGCGAGDYCPNAAVTRAQMAVFLLKGLLGSGYSPPPATGTVFSDVPAGSFAAAWIEELEARGITSGCGGGRFCPASVNTRGQMAVFLVSTFSLQ